MLNGIILKAELIITVAGLIRHMIIFQQHTEWTLIMMNTVTYMKIFPISEAADSEAAAETMTAIAARY